MTYITCPTCGGSGRIPLPYSDDTLTCGTCNGERHGTRFDCDGVLVNDDKWRDRCYQFSKQILRLLDATPGTPLYTRTIATLERMATSYGKPAPAPAGDGGT